MDITDNWELNLAEEAVNAAYSILEKNLYGSRVLEKIDGREWKIGADRKLELTIINVLQRGSSYPILAEESGLIAASGNRRWIVDPLDGSANYFRDIPFYSISVGLWENNHPVLGVVLDVTNKRLFKGVVNLGAWCDSSSIQVYREMSSTPISKILCTGFPAGFVQSDQNMHKLSTLCDRFGKVRMLGSAALMLCFVASGKCDSYWESQIGLWDVGAALAIVKAAGGVIRLGNIGDNYRVDVEAAASVALLAGEISGY